MSVTKLDEAIKAAGIPIDGVSGSTNTRIDFRTEATEEQRAAAQAIADEWDFAGLKEKADAFTAAIAAGFDTGHGWRLPLDAHSRGELDKLRNQLREGMELAGWTNETPCPIPLLDTEGQPHLMTVGDVRKLIFAGGNYYAGLVANSR